MTSIQELPSVLQQVIERSKTHAVALTLTKKEDPLSLTDSKMGGLGYIPQEANYPYAPDGKPLVLLIQINFEQLAQVVDVSKLPQPLPKSGLLQIYIASDDELYGADFDDARPSASYQVRFWQDLSRPINEQALDLAKTDIAQIDDLDDGILPFNYYDNIGISYSLIEQACGINCIEFNQILTTVDTQATDKDVFEYFESIEGEEAETLFERYEAVSGIDDYPHHILGYPNFTQTDPREYNDALKDHILLLQIDSDYDVDLMWGDIGIANFFITPEALADKDFSQLAYNWDCS